MLTILISIILFILSSTGVLVLGDVADPIVIPTLSEIESVRIGNSSTRTDEEIKQKAIEFLQSAVPTKRQSVNDTPRAEEYTFFMLQGPTNEYLYRGYFYEVEHLFGLTSEWYYEIPYNGIYEVSEDFVEALLAEWNGEN
ncbi:MAG: DUF5301 domain-containing protein [Clostridia bacterium]|nr:DUF5301 domain-containing protein [Clostridia bacterium]